MARLKEQYKAEVAPALYKKFGYKSTMEVPKIADGKKSRVCKHCGAEL